MKQFCSSEMLQGTVVLKEKLVLWIRIQLGSVFSNDSTD